MRISDRITVEHYGELLDIGTLDIHDNTDTAGWIDMSLFDQIAFYVTIGPTAAATWHTDDQLDTLHILQANTATGGGPAKALDPAVNLDQTTTNSPGQTFCLECTAAHCDTVGGFHWVRLEASEDHDSGDNFCIVTVVKYAARYQHGDMAATTAEA